MKKARLIIVLLTILSVFVLAGFTNDRDFEISVGEDYEYFYNDESASKVVNRLNDIYNQSHNVVENADSKPYNDKELKAYLKDNDICFLAVGKYDYSQIRVAVYNDKISEKMQDLSSKSDSKINEFAMSLVKDKSLQYEIYSRDARKYIRIFENRVDNGGEYTVSQFITVCNGKVFNISFFNDGKELNPSAYKILDTFEIKDVVFVSKTPVYIVIFVALGIAVFICLIIYMIWGIVKSNRKASPEKETDSEDIIPSNDDEIIKKE